MRAAPVSPAGPGPLAAAPSGVLAIDKPSGWTSFDVVAALRRTLGVRRIGHGGTLDPAASGLLPVLVGSATHFAERLHTAPKVYAALVRFGTETTTDDREGPVRREAAVPELDEAAMGLALGAFRGDVDQVPPDFAAVKIAGRRAYTIARTGAPVVIASRTVRIDRLEIASWRPPELRLLIVCGSGTYVRALARDLGRAVGSAAHLAGLRRLAVGALTVDDAVDVGTARAEGGDVLVARLRPADDGLLEIPSHYRTASAGDVLRGWEGA